MNPKNETDYERNLALIQAIQDGIEVCQGGMKHYLKSIINPPSPPKPEPLIMVPDEIEFYKAEYYKKDGLLGLGIDNTHLLKWFPLEKDWNIYFIADCFLGSPIKQPCHLVKVEAGERVAGEYYLGYNSPWLEQAKGERHLYDLYLGSGKNRYIGGGNSIREYGMIRNNYYHVVPIM